MARLIFSEYGGGVSEDRIRGGLLVLLELLLWLRGGGETRHKSENGAVDENSSSMRCCCSFRCSDAVALLIVHAASVFVADWFAMIRIGVGGCCGCRFE
jgi:hypothetical protein